MDFQQVNSIRTNGVNESRQEHTTILTASSMGADGLGAVRESTPVPGLAAPVTSPWGSPSTLVATANYEAVPPKRLTPLNTQFELPRSQPHIPVILHRDDGEEPAPVRYDEDGYSHKASTSTLSECPSTPAESTSCTEVTQESPFGFGPLDRDIQERRGQIEESDSELIGSGSSDNTSSGDDTGLHVAFAPIRGESVPNRALLDAPQLSAAPSEITDLGDQQWANRQSQNHAQSLPPQVDQTLPLRARIHQSLVAISSSKGFLPKGAIDILVTEDSVARELARRKSRKSAKSTSVQDIARQVCQDQAPELRAGKSKSRRARSFRNIFAILVVAKKPSAIRHFIEEGVSDADLPLVKIPRPNLQNVFDLRRSGEKDRPLDCFRGWDSIEILDFEEWQWMTLSPFFAKGARKDVKHYPLPDRIILPFTLDSRQQNTDVEIGGYSQVFKVDIHPGHHDFHEDKTATSSFAIKQLDSRDKSDFKKEVEMLKKFSDYYHPHLVSLLATYEQFNCYYLIFHWADADLFSFWQKTRPNPIFNHDTVRWVAQQCQGIASGLAKIHRHVTVSDMENDQLFGRHGDIKPENILWFSDPTDSSDKGTLKITDFGLAEFNSRQSRSNKPGHEVANSPTYRPPECVLRGRVIRRSYDIWSLACVYLMFITWLLGGRTLLDQFALRRLGLGKYKPNHPEIQDDAFFEIIKDDDDETEGVVKSAVIEFIEGLHKHPKCSDFIHEFLDMITGDMLVVEYVKQGNRRITSAEVHSKLNKMHTKCVKSKEYAIGARNAKKSHRVATKVPQLPKTNFERLAGRNGRVQGNVFEVAVQNPST